jgi:hypothetical protein
LLGQHPRIALIFFVVAQPVPGYGNARDARWWRHCARDTRRRRMLIAYTSKKHCHILRVRRLSMRIAAEASSQPGTAIMRRNPIVKT